ncbi:hypothetical protein ANANG_G00198060, partial [Anguilla anguilla]
QAYSIWFWSASAVISNWDFVASLPSVLLFFTQGQVKLTNRRVGKRKVSSRKRKKVEYRPTEGDPRNTQASFRLQDFKMWKFSMFLECFELHVLFLLALSPRVNSKEIPMPRMCAVCLDKDCAIGVRIIYPASSDTAVWSKANSRTGIQTCSRENLKADAPCKMANGSLVQLADNPLHFEGIDTYGVRRIFKSQISREYSCSGSSLQALLLWCSVGGTEGSGKLADDFVVKSKLKMWY